MEPRLTGPVKHRLRDGSAVCVRPVRLEDTVELERAFMRLSEQSRYQRFHTGRPTLGARLGRYFSDVDHTDHEALIATPTEESPTIVGVARFIRDHRTPHHADLAFTVAEEWQGHGLATLLLDLVSERARAEGIRRFTLHMLADNTAVLALVRAAGGWIGDDRAGVVSGHIDLDDTASRSTHLRG